MPIILKTFLIACFLVCAYGSQAHAQDGDITPSHVYRQTEIWRVMLDEQELINKARYQAVTEDVSLRHPRHVMQKVSECHMQLSKILQARGKEAETLPVKHVMQEIRPADVYNGMQHLIRETGKLNGGQVPEITLVNGKLPADVYNNLKKICRALEAGVEPADIYRVATAVRDNMKAIAEARHYEIKESLQSGQDKISADVYEKTIAFMQDLRILALNPDYAIPGGVIVVDERTRSYIVPQDVIAVMYDALAETEAIKYSLHIEDDLVLPPYKSGVTPSDVYAVVNQIHRITKELIKLESEASEAEGEPQ